MKKRSVIVNEDGTASVFLTKGQVAVIDAADVGLVERYNWHAQFESRGENWYAKTSERLPVEGYKYGRLPMQNVICGVERGVQVDHIDHNGLNNRRSNLRVATGQLNKANRRTFKNNTSGYRGVGRFGDRWLARIRVNGKGLSLGVYDSPEEAAFAYNIAATMYFGEFASLNSGVM
jgi:hypothetical protein